MGLFPAKPFLPSEIDGQGKDVLKLAKRLFITKYELDRLYHEFIKNEDHFSHLITTAEMFKKLKAPYSLFFQVLYQLYDTSKRGLLNFQEYVVATWAFLSLSDDGIATLCFHLFDVDRYYALDVWEIKYLINVIWSFAPNKATQRAMAKMDKNQDSVITVDEFLVLCRHHPQILAPLKKTQKILQKKTVYARFWREMKVRRTTHFGLKSIIQLRALSGVNVVTLSMEYLNLRKDVVPNHFVEQWRLIQKKKAQSYKGNIELPYEVREKILQESGGQEIELWNSSVFMEESSIELEQSSYVL